MKAKLQIPSAIVALSMATPAFARTHVVQTRSGQRVVTNVGNDRDHWHSSSSGVSWNIGIGLPFYGGYYGGYPYYGGSFTTAAIRITDRTGILHTIIAATITVRITRTIRPK